MLNTSQVPRLQTTAGAPAHPNERRVNCPALKVFTAPATVRFARHEHAQITRDTAPSRKSIHITPPAGTKADREALRALSDSQQGVVDKYRRALHMR